MIHLRLLALLLGFAAFAVQARPPAAVTRFEFKSEGSRGFLFDTNLPAHVKTQITGKTAANQWIRGHREHDPENYVEAGSRLTVQFKDESAMKRLLSKRPLQISRKLGANTFILQAPDVVTALRESARLAKSPDVLSSSPVLRESLQKHCVKAAAPNDPLYPTQWHLEQRDTNDLPLGVDLNARAAWAVTKGAGVAIGFGDDGIETDHPDLASRGAGMPHFNFATGTTDGSPVLSTDNHGTPLAGLAVAEMNNGLGGAGVAPEAGFASWKIFNGNSIAVNNEQLMNMFQYANDSVAVQNHSWGNNSTLQIPMALESRFGVDHAVNNGRNGKGVVIVRSVPERRGIPGTGQYGDVNDDGYPSDPSVIAVAGLLPNGRHGSGSNPGAPILVAAGGGEFGTATLVTTDRQGEAGYNTAADESGDYSAPSGFGRGGTSFAAPQIAGLAALLLSINPELGYRDVQQILAHSARHFEPNDPDLTANGAGLVVSHNDGYGVPDASLAVSLASLWENRPALTKISVPMDQTNFVTADDSGLVVLVSDSPVAFDPIPAAPSVGLHPDEPTTILPLADVGNGSEITDDLTGKAALIQRGGGPFATTVKNAANAGAAFAIIYNNTNTTTPRSMTGLEYVPIPAVFIGRDEGEALAEVVRSEGASAQLKVFSTNVTFTVTNELSCEHVAVSVELACRRGDVRLTLTSPDGTSSILQRVNNDTNSVGLVVWTYTSTHHFHESSAGTWTLTIADEAPGDEATLTAATLTINGVPITDSDRDGMDDGWELALFSDLSKTAQDDEDADGFSNIREFIMGTNPKGACGHVVSRTEITLGAAGGTTNLTIGTLPECAWTASSLTDWITVTTNAGCGPARLQLNFTQNPYPTNRTGTLIVAGYGVTVNQASSLIPPSIAGKSFRLTIATGSGDFATNGSFLFIASATNTFQIVPLTDGIDPTVGTFTYDPATGDIIADNGIIIRLTFVDSINGTFFSTHESGEQTGTFLVLRSGPDFDGNGRIDLILQHTNGVVATWLMNGGQFLTNAFLKGGLPAAKGWRVVGADDFDKDGHCDVLLQHTTDKLAVWLMEGTTVRASQMLRDGFAPTGWKTVGLADVNYDNSKDIIFQNAKRKLSAWHMNGTNYISSTLLRPGQPAALGWRAFGAIDFPGTNITHILFQHSTGKLARWVMSGPTFLASEPLRPEQSPPAGLRASALADLDSDGRQDIVFQNRNRVAIVWYMDGTNFISSDRLRDGKPLATGWQVVAPR